jgi:hypothetical protein
LCFKKGKASQLLRKTPPATYTVNHTGCRSTASTLGILNAEVKDPLKSADATAQANPTAESLAIGKVHRRPTDEDLSGRLGDVVALVWGMINTTRLHPSNW